MERFFTDNAVSIGKTPLVRIKPHGERDEGYGAGEDRGSQPGLFREVPDRCEHDLGRGAPRVPQPWHGDHRADERNTGIALAFVAAAAGIGFT